MNYVVLFVGDDGCLGQTIGPIADWDEAVQKAIALAESRGEMGNEEELAHLCEFGNLKTPSGSICIGGLTSDVE